MPIIRTRADIDDLLGGPTPAEAVLLQSCAAGLVCQVNNGVLPSQNAGLNQQIRADILRYLVLGGCADWQVHGSGVQLIGARIIGALDISHQPPRVKSN